MPLNVREFLLSDFEGRIHLVNQACNARLWSSQLAPIWRDIIRQLERAGDQYGAVARKLTRELLVLAPDSVAAEEAYRNWMRDDGLRSSILDPAIVYLVVSCEKYKQKALTLYNRIVSHLNPTFIVLGNEKIDEAVFSGEFLTVPAPDNYESLPKKVLEALVAVRREFGKVGTLKIDDDAQFHAEPDNPKIRELVSSVDYAGWIVGNSDIDRCWHVGKCEHLKDEPYSKRFRGSWAAGPLYYLGPNAVEFLVRDYTSFPGEFTGRDCGFEDKVVGDALRAHQIIPNEARLSEIFGINLPGGGLADLPEVAPLTIDWQGVKPMSTEGRSGRVKFEPTWEDLDLEFHVVSMRKSERRRSRMEQELSERRIRHRFIDAIDGDDIAAVRGAFVCDPGFVLKVDAPRTRPLDGRELACTLSHMRAIRRAHDMGLRQVVVCEDDIEIGDVDAGEIVDILAAMPADAAYIQLCVLGAATVHGLVEYYIKTRRLFAKKRNDDPTKFVEQPLANLTCHSTAAYIITTAGMRNCDRFFEGCRVLFPGHEDEISSNVGLIPDRFVYQAATDERHQGYACCMPTFLIEGVDSLLHPEHVEQHQEARSAAEFCRTLIKNKCSIRATEHC